MSLLEEKVYNLTTGFEYAFKGDNVTAVFIKIIPPTSKTIKHCSVIKQLFYRAATSIKNPENAAKEVEEKDSEKDSDDESYYDIFYISESVDIELVLDSFRKLFKTGVLLLDGETKLTDPLLDKISLPDFEKLASIYLGNYIAASMLSA